MNPLSAALFFAAEHADWLLPLAFGVALGSLWFFVEMYQKF